MEDDGIFGDCFTGGSSYGGSTIEQMLAMNGDGPIEPPGETLSTTEIRDLTPVYEDDIVTHVKERRTENNENEPFGLTPRISPPEENDRPKTFEERLEESYVNHQKNCDSFLFSDEETFHQTIHNPVIEEDKEPIRTNGNFSNTKKQFPYLKYQDKPVFPLLGSKDQRYRNSLPHMCQDIRTTGDNGYPRQQRYSSQPPFMFVHPVYPPMVVPPNGNPAAIPSHSQPSPKKFLPPPPPPPPRNPETNNRGMPGVVMNNFQRGQLFILEGMYQKKIPQGYQAAPPTSTSAPGSFLYGVRQRRNTIGTLPPRVMDLTRGRFRKHNPSKLSITHFPPANTHEQHVFPPTHHFPLPRSFPANNNVNLRRSVESGEEEEEVEDEDEEETVTIRPPVAENLNNGLKEKRKNENFGRKPEGRRLSGKRRKKRKYSRKNVRIDDIDIDRNEIMKLFGKVRNYKGMLPGRSSDVLRDWFCDHLQSPYPTNEEKRILVEKSGLKENQVMNWFTNKRKRIWKPYIEERRKKLIEAKKSIVKKGKKTGYFRHERRLRARKKY